MLKKAYQRNYGIFIRQRFSEIPLLRIVQCKLNQRIENYVNIWFQDLLNTKSNQRLWNWLFPLFSAQCSTKNCMWMLLLAIKNSSSLWQESIYLEQTHLTYRFETRWTNGHFMYKLVNLMKASIFIIVQ